MGESATDNMKDDIIDLKERGEIARDKFEKHYSNNTYVFQNHLQNWSPIPKIQMVLDNISTSIVDAMRAVSHGETKQWII